MLPVHDWTDRAACAEYWPDLWFPPFTNKPTHEAWDEPRAICNACPVRFDCLTAALDRSEDEGMWGGLTPSELREMRKREANGGATPIKSQPTPDWRCGDYSGYSRHRRRNERPCEPCREANNERRQRNRERERARQSA